MNTAEQAYGTMKRAEGDLSGSAIERTPIQTLPPQDSERYRGIFIRPLSKGFIVAVGCQEFAINTVENLVEYLNQYYKDPKSTEDKYFAGNLFF